MEIYKSKIHRRYYECLHKYKCPLGFKKWVEDDLHDKPFWGCIYIGACLKQNAKKFDDLLQGE